MLFTVPDYYPEFHCKMGACRHACCEGWPVSLSMQDYFRLLGEDLSPELRRRMDTSLHIHKYATPDDYAFIAPRWDGNCPLRHEDGRCALQMEKGEEALTYVCRLYPRGIRTAGTPECSCAASCERVTELLLFRPEPLKFIKTELELPLPPHLEKTVFDGESTAEEAERLKYISVMQDRSLSLPERLMKLYSVMTDAECTEAFETSPVTYQQLSKGILLAERILAFAEEHSSAVHDYGKEALEYFGKGYQAVQKYLSAVKLLDGLLPDPGIVFEHLMVNHMFFEQWPFHSELDTPLERFSALCAVYALIRFLALGYTAVHHDIHSFCDCISAAFRLTEHTSFDKFICPLLQECGYAQVKDMIEFIQL